MHGNMKLTGYCHLMSAFRSATGCVRTAHLHGETPVPVTVRPTEAHGQAASTAGLYGTSLGTIIWDTASRVVIPGRVWGSSKTGYASLNYRGGYGNASAGYSHSGVTGNCIMG